MNGPGKRREAIVAMVLALGLAVAFVPACRNTAEGVTEDTRLNAEQAREGAQTAGAESEAAARKIGADAKEAGSTIGQVAKNVAGAVRDGAQEVASDAGAGKQTVDIKAALMAAKGIDATHIDVDTDANTRTVTLKGTVPTASQRTAAADLARDKAQGYRIRNLLTVAKAQGLRW